eukprot:evm.model.scf_322.5 EVM.evm.TU.scf_322.5   scf_322:88790-90652(-)
MGAADARAFASCPGTASISRAEPCHGIQLTAWSRAHRRQSSPRLPLIRTRVADAATEADALPTEQSLPSMAAVKTAEDIMAILPHRYPFLLVDRVVELEAGKCIVGYKNVTMNDNFFTGHFPDRPIMPGVLQVEALAQLGGLLVLEDADESARSNFFFGGVENCRFRKPVVPGDTLMMRVEITKFNKRFGICKVNGKAYVGSDIVCDADLTLVIAKS